MVTHKLNLRVVFPENIKTRRITIQQLRDFVQEECFNMPPGDFDVVVRFFTAHEAKREQTTERSGTSRTQQPSPVREVLIDLGKMIVYTRRLDPTYAKDESTAAAKPGAGANKVTLSSFPERMKQILKKYAEYMVDMQITKEGLFEEIDRNRDGRVNVEELVKFTTVNCMVEGVSSSDVEMLFSFLDTNQDGSISINEFCMLVQGLKLSIDARLNSFSYEFEAQMKTEIESLFDRLDVDRNGALTADEFAQMLRPTDSKGRMTLDRAYEIVRTLDTDGDSRISKSEFVAYIMPRQKKQILDFDDQMEDLRRLFKEQIAEGVAWDPNDNSVELLNKN